MSGQLFDAGGPIRPSRRRSSHHKPTVTPACKHPGCQQPRLYHHQYCAEHATSINYQAQGWRPPGIERECKGCGRIFVYQPTAGRTASVQNEVWWTFCLACHRTTPLTLERLIRHRVPAELMTTWLRLGDQLCCDICVRRLSNSLKPVIDHDHHHCGGSLSCGLCIRGVLCVGCNTLIGQIETRLDDEGRSRLEGYLAKEVGDFGREG